MSHLVKVPLLNIFVGCLTVVFSLYPLYVIGVYRNSETIGQPKSVEVLEIRHSLGEHYVNGKKFQFQRSQGLLLRQDQIRMLTLCILLIKKGFQACIRRMAGKGSFWQNKFRKCVKKCFHSETCWKKNNSSSIINVIQAGLEICKFCTFGDFRR